jgi:hypothetical protein
MARPEAPFSRLRAHHVMMAVIAIIVGLALVSNYYLW